MERIIKERTQGKTTELIKLSSEKQIPILVTTNWASSFLQERAQELNLKIPSPLVMNPKFQKLNNQDVLIDELDYIAESILKEHFGLNLKGFTQTKPRLISKKDIATKFNTIPSEIEIVD